MKSQRQEGTASEGGREGEMVDGAKGKKQPRLGGDARLTALDKREKGAVFSP